MDTTVAKMEHPLITTIMPIKDYKEDYLRDSLQSMFNQTSSRWHLVIVVEEADHAHFSELLKKELEDDRVDLIIMEGKPFTGSINTGMRYARTEFVALLFADDLWDLNAIKILNDHITSYPTVDFFHSSRAKIDEQGRIISSVIFSKEKFCLDQFKWGSPVKHLLCWRREKGLSVGGIDESIYKAPDDYDFPWTMAENNAVFKAVKECLYYHRNHCEFYRKTTHIPLSQAKRDIIKILKKHGVGFFQRHIIVRKLRRQGGLGKQSIYRNSMERWIKDKLGIDARRSWTQSVYK